MSKCDENIDYKKLSDYFEIGFVCDDGYYVTKVKVINIFHESELIVFICEKPNNIEYKQNREYFRVNAKFNCEYKWHTEDGIKTLKTQTINISANGVTIYVPIKEYIPQFCELVLNIDDKKNITDAQYVRQEEVQGGYNVSYKFVGIKESTQDYIAQTCIKLQIANKRLFI